jgi:glycosyltransferase involved in cell wall biosynthesis
MTTHAKDQLIPGFVIGNDILIKKETGNGLDEISQISTLIDDINQVFQNTSVSVIIPVLNEEQNLRHVLPKIPKEYEIIMVDGHSSDRTIELAKKLRPDIRILMQPGKGKGDAMRHGFKHAQGDVIVTFDADGSFDTKEISSFVQSLVAGNDLVKGSRFIHGGNTIDMPLFRKMGNWVLTTLTNVLFGTKYTDLAYGFHAFRRNALEKINLESDGFEIDTELYLKAKKAGLRISEVPSFENKRIFGEGKLKSFQDGWRILKMIISERVHAEV